MPERSLSLYRTGINAIIVGHAEWFDHQANGSTIVIVTTQTKDQRLSQASPERR